MQQFHTRAKDNIEILPYTYYFLCVEEKILVARYRRKRDSSMVSTILYGMVPLRASMSGGCVARVDDGWMMDDEPGRGKGMFTSDIS